MEHGSGGNDPQSIPGWQRGQAGIGVLSFDGPSGSPRLLLCSRDVPGGGPDAVADRLGVDARRIAAFLKLYPEGVFTLMLGPGSGGMSHATLRELVARLDRRLRPASRWDF